MVFERKVKSYKSNYAICKANQPTQRHRREKPLWEMLETIVNEQLRNISVVGQDGRVSISLDDDKVWINLSNSASQDLFCIYLSLTLSKFELDDQFFVDKKPI